MKRFESKARARTIARPDARPQLWFHSALLAAALIATVAVGIASAALYSGPIQASKSDRLPIVQPATQQYEVVETRADGLSVLERVPRAAVD